MKVKLPPTHEEAVMAAVRSLRTALGMTQTDFGRALEKSLPTIQRWETLRPPRGAALANLYRTAVANDLDEIAQTFSRALMLELAETGDAVSASRVIELGLRAKDLAAALPPSKKSKELVAAIEQLLSELIRLGPVAQVAAFGSKGRGPR